MAIHKQLSAEVARHADSMLGTAADLIRFPTVSGQEDCVLEYLTNWFQSYGFSIQVQPLATSTNEPLLDEPRVNERANVLVTLGDDPSKPTVVINGHIDVVPPGDPGSWTTAPPFSGERKNGIIIGRGASDTKGGVAAAMYALLILKESVEPLSVNVALELVVGEETTGVGTRVISEIAGTADMAIVLEPTQCAIAPISTGLQFFTVNVHGKSAHSSSPWKGRDAFAHLQSVHRAMEDLASERNNAFKSPHYASIPSAAPFAVGSVRAGELQASIPEHAEMSGRFGILPDESIASVRSEIGRIIKGIDDLARWPIPTKIHWGASWNAWATDENHILVRSLADAMRTRTGSAKLVGLTAGSDAAFFGQDHIPTVVFGPGDMSLAHSPNEFVEDSDILNACFALVHTVLGMRKVGLADVESRANDFTNAH